MEVGGDFCLGVPLQEEAAQPLGAFGSSESRPGTTGDSEPPTSTSQASSRGPPLRLRLAFLLLTAAEAVVSSGEAIPPPPPPPLVGGSLLSDSALPRPRRSVKGVLRTGLEPQTRNRLSEVVATVNSSLHVTICRGGSHDTLSVHTHAWYQVAFTVKLMQYWQLYSQQDFKG